MNILDLLTDFEKIRTKTLSYNAGDYIFNSDEKCDSIGIVESGRVQISSPEVNGHSTVYHTLKQGEMIGIFLVFSSEPFYRVNTIALTDCKVTFIHRDDLKIILQQNEKFLETFLRLQSNFATILNYRTTLFSINSAVERVMFALAHQKNNEIKYHSVVELAESLGLTREATSRTIYKLKKEGKVLLNNKVISLKK